MVLGQPLVIPAEIFAAFNADDNMNQLQQTIREVCPVHPDSQDRHTKVHPQGSPRLLKHLPSNRHPQASTDLGSTSPSVYGTHSTLHGVLLHVWGGSSFTRLLDGMEAKAFRFVGDACLTSSLDSLSLCRRVASLTIFCRIYFGYCSLEL